MMPKIRMIGRYGSFRVGQIINPPASLRKILFDRKLAEFVDEGSVRPPQKKQPRRKK